MATDAQILTARSEYYAACAALEAANAAKLKLSRELDAASAKCDEAVRKRNEWQGTLLRLAASKPAEPAPKPGLVELPPQPIWATEPPKNMADGMATLSDADAPAPKPTPVEPAPVTPPAVPQRRREKARA